MAVINDELPTLLDQARRLDPNGAVAMIAEVLTRRNAFLQSMVFQEGNLPTGTRFTSRTALPSVAWRRFNEGVAPSKSKTDQVDETCGMLEGFSAVDVDLANLGGNAPAFRASEDKGFMQALNNEVETGIAYHSTKTAPEKFMGFSPRLDSTTGVAGSQIIQCDAAAAGNDNTSIWLVSWGPDTVYGIYPKGSSAGIEHKDMGEQLWEDANGKKFRAFVTNWKWKLGICVKDWRYLVRICNIDTGSLSGTDDTIIPAMIKAVHQLQDLNSGRTAFYCNRTVSTYLHLQARNAVKNATLKVEAPEGRPVMSFLGIPILQTDALTNTEATVA